eukprot:Platyproteum_vivax@DN15495_c0_g1_i1.p1
MTSGSSPKDRILYPQYLDKNKTIAEGRRIPLKNAVENPTVPEMCKVCEHFKIPHQAEMNKAYPRDWMNPGRLSVSFYNNDGALANKDIPDKKALMLKMAELIPKLKSRHETKADAPPQKRKGKK